MDFEPPGISLSMLHRHEFASKIDVQDQNFESVTADNYGNNTVYHDRTEAKLL